MGNQAMLGVHEETRNRLYDLKGDKSYDEIAREWIEQELSSDNSEANE